MLNIPTDVIFDTCDGSGEGRYEQQHDLSEGSSASPTGRGGAALSVGDAIRYGWNRFKTNAWTWIGAVVIAAIIQSVLNILFGNRSTFRVDTFGQSLWTIGWIIVSIVTVVIGYLINAALVPGALHEVDGQRPSLGSFFRFTNVGIASTYAYRVVSGSEVAPCHQRGSGSVRRTRAATGQPAAVLVDSYRRSLVEVDPRL